MTGTPPRARELAALTATLDGALVQGKTARRIAGLTHDSRKVRPGFAFVALRGERHDGHDFVAASIASGAVAVVVDLAHAASVEVPNDVTLIAVEDTRSALARLAATFYDRPSSALAVIGVTGTNGKTTTTFLIEAILNAAGIPCGRIGTLGAQFRSDEWPLGNTTPLALELQATLAEMRDRGACAVAVEVSSHALALERVAEVAFAIGVLTNVSRDHLDFHGTFEAYAAEKRKLFRLAADAIFNADDSLGRRWAAEFPPSPWRTFGIAGDAAVRASDVTFGPNGSTFVVDGTRFSLRLPGAFNVSNALAALAVARALAIDDGVTSAALAGVDAVPGRMEHFSGAGVEAIVDYAHTPGALENVLRAARAGASGRLVAVFGCGGDRDRGKRPEMGRIASELADVVVVTSDNPRSEDPEAIVAEIVAGVSDRSRLRIDVDRASAIRSTVLDARRGDTIVVAGKGHETYQIVGSETRHFDDREEVLCALRERLAESDRPLRHGEPAR
jgi:UDP-N-acetylmuramoyl-L-alanyl-D-glutamate--2,6-diaminopimelate ligase